MVEVDTGFSQWVKKGRFSDHPSGEWHRLRKWLHMGRLDDSMEGTQRKHLVYLQGPSSHRRGWGSPKWELKNQKHQQKSRDNKHRKFMSEENVLSNSISWFNLHFRCTQNF